ncbi:MAG: AAA+ family ATPase [Rhodobacter sp.]|nr:AAA+ family ATPase [Rhodobacter sp.]MCA3512865.1 AAA+ family ATPase [Rhodobacter sp.]MCA3521423.1 AAA+ family ATPase [Rhodobacter sp.]MCA3524138.1 AAA+ family ATPase [Rhodobacter sp.]MCA3526989.1 AAA+ family ATPase [Rhodobacter sp.]
MKHAVLMLMLLALPVRAQEVPAPPPSGGSVQEGVDLLERGMRSILDGLVTEMQPAIDGMSRALTGMGPLADQVFALIDNIGNYEAPVILENGDILIRRKPAAPPPLPAPLKEGEVDL